MINWLSPEDAIRAIDAAKRSGTPLHGFDGAYIRGKTTQPSLEDSWDYGAKAYPTVADAYAHAIKFIQDRAGKGLHFEIVLGKPSN
jgi:hypothetical protein